MISPVNTGRTGIQRKRENLRDGGVEQDGVILAILRVVIKHSVLQFENEMGLDRVNRPESRHDTYINSGSSASQLHDLQRLNPVTTAIIGQRRLVACTPLIKVITLIVAT